MPWHATNQRQECSGWAVVKDDDGELVGCHDTREEADAQVRALYAKEPEAAQAAAAGCACQHPEGGLRQIPNLPRPGFVAAVATEPFESPFPVPEYPPAEWFDRPDWVAAYRDEQGLGPDVEVDAAGNEILRLTVTDEGRVGGYFYQAGQCLVHMPDACPKPSPTSYAAFHQNDVAVDGGALLRVGVIGNTHGHASPWVKWVDAQRHYADPSAQMIVCRAGDDERGGWIAGALVPGATYGDVALIRRCALSGDWRPDFGEAWWRANGVTPAQVAAADGYDCVGPTLVTRPGLPLPQGEQGRLRAASAESRAETPFVVVAASMTPIDEIVAEEAPMSDQQTIELPGGVKITTPVGAPVTPQEPTAAVETAAPPAAAETEVVVEGEPLDDEQEPEGDVAELRAEVGRLSERLAAVEEFMNMLVAEQEQIAAAAAVKLRERIEAAVAADDELVALAAT